MRGGEYGWKYPLSHMSEQQPSSITAHPLPTLGKEGVDSAPQDFVLDVTRRFYSEEMLRQMQNDHHFVHRTGPYAHREAHEVF